jgi:hypothetical protein
VFLVASSIHWLTPVKGCLLLASFASVPNICSAKQQNAMDLTGPVHYPKERQPWTNFFFFFAGCDLEKKS